MDEKIVTIICSLVISTGSSKAAIVCTTTVLASIVEDLTGEKCEVVAPPSICPAHYDVKPSDIEKIREADLVFCHGIEPWVDELLKASGNNVTVLKGAKIVVDNLQSGTEIGDRLVRELNAVEVALSNFPAEGNVTRMMLENAEKLSKALEMAELLEKRESKGIPGLETIAAVFGLTAALAVGRR